MAPRKNRDRLLAKRGTAHAQGESATKVIASAGPNLDMSYRLIHNLLRSILLRYYPADLEAFPNLDSVVGLAFLQTYPTFQQAQALPFEQLKIFLREHHHTHGRDAGRVDLMRELGHARSSQDFEEAEIHNWLHLINSFHLRSSDDHPVPRAAENPTSL